MRLQRILAGAFAAALSLTPALACTLANPGLEPGRISMIDGVDSIEPMLWLYLGNGEVDAVVPAYYDDVSQRYSFTVPPLRGYAWSGTQVTEIWLTDGENICDLGTANLGPLSRAPGAFRTMLAMQVKTEKLRERFTGQSYVEIVRRNLVDFDAIVTQHSASPEFLDALKIVDAMYARGDRVQHQIALQKHWRSGLAALGPAPLEGWRKGELSPERRPGFGNGPERIWRAQATHKPEWRPDFSALSASDLSRLMIAQFPESIAQRPHISRLRDTSGMMLGVAAALSEGAGTVSLTFILKVSGEAAFWAGIYSKVINGLSPYTLTDARIIGGPVSLGLKGKPNQGWFTKFLVTPHSKGLNMTQIAADIALQYTPFSFVGKVLKKGGINIGGKIGSKMSAPARERVGELIKKLSEKSHRLGDSANTFVHGKNWREPPLKIIPYLGPKRRPWFIPEKFLPEGNASTGEFNKAAGGAVEAIMKYFISTFGISSSSFPTIGTIPPFKWPETNILVGGYYNVWLDGAQVIGILDTVGSISYGSLKDGITVMSFISDGAKFGNTQVKVRVSIIVTEGLHVDPDRVRLVIPGDALEYTAMALFDGERTKGTGQSGFEVTPLRDTTFYYDGKDRSATVYRVQTPESKRNFPGVVTFSLKKGGPRTIERRIRIARMTPLRTCIDFGETVNFMALNELGENLSRASFALIGPGEMLGNGQYIAPENAEGSIKVMLVVPETLEILDEQTIKLGCTCHWSASIAGTRMKGEILSASNISVGGISTYLVMPIDGDNGVFGITGEGPLMAPKDIGVTLQVGATSWMSGKAATRIVNLGNALHDTGCAMPQAQIEDWSRSANGRWLVGAVSGTAGRDVDIVNIQSCAPLSPFRIEFRVPLASSSPKLSALQLLAQSSHGGESAAGMLTGFGSMVNVIDCLSAIENETK